MIETIRKLLQLLTRAERRRGALVLLLLTLMASLEVVGIASVMPFLSVIGDRSLIETNAQLNWLFTSLHFASTDMFLLFLGGCAFSLIIAVVAVRVVTIYVINRFVEMRRHSIAMRLMETYLRQPYVFFLNRHTGDLSRGVLSEVDYVTSRVMLPAGKMVAQILTLAAIVVFLLMLDPIVTLVIGGTLIAVYGLIYVSIRAYLAYIGSARVIANRARFQVAGEALSGIKNIKILGCEPEYLRRLARPSSAMAGYQSISATLSEVPKYIVEALAFGGVILLSLILLLREGGRDAAAFGHILPLLGVYAFAGYRLLPALQHIYAAVNKVRFGAAAVESVHRDLAQRQELPPLPSEPTPRLCLTRELRLENLSFSYPNAEGVGIHDISLTIPKGSSLGVVGTTGAGKTTLVDLMLGLLTHSSGRLVLDGQAISPEDVRSWQRCLGYVPQDAFLIDASVAANIALGLSPEAIDRGRVEECARMAHIHDFIARNLPDGYDTAVGDRGMRLSGGQRQRIGIARALYHDPEIIVFDEATNALDTRTESDVLAAVGALSGKKTLIMITHRVDTVKSCDQILVLENGRMTGLGSYNELFLGNSLLHEVVPS